MRRKRRRRKGERKLLEPSQGLQGHLKDKLFSSEWLLLPITITK